MNGHLVTNDVTICNVIKRSSDCRGNKIKVVE